MCERESELAKEKVSVKGEKEREKESRERERKREREKKKIQKSYEKKREKPSHLNEGVCALRVMLEAETFIRSRMKSMTYRRYSLPKGRLFALPFV